MDREIPCVFMRGGTSRGPYFRAEDLPADTAERDRILLCVMGSPHPSQINGLGGGNTVTSKVAIMSRSTHAGCDADYLFAQVSPDKALVDTRPNCGNMLSGIGPFAIEEGLVKAGSRETTVRIFNINTQTVVEAIVQTPNGHVNYEGDTRIDGVPGTGAPIVLSFLNAEGGVTGSLFPTGARIDMIDGVPVTCIDIAMPLMIIDASSLGLNGNERPDELDSNAPLMRRIEQLRLMAGKRMGLGDVSDSVVPKPVIVSRGDGPFTVQSRYFTPYRCHGTHAVTGAIAVASSFVIPGTVTHRLGNIKLPLSSRISVVHPSGRIEIALDVNVINERVEITRAGVVRTARKIMKGSVFIPTSII